MCALTPPRFLTRKSPDFLKAQLITNPKSDSNTQVERLYRHVPPATKISLQFHSFLIKPNTEHAECIFIRGRMIIYIIYTSIVIRPAGWYMVSSISEFQLKFRGRGNYFN